MYAKSVFKIQSNFFSVRRSENQRNHSHSRLAAELNFAIEMFVINHEGILPVSIGISTFRDEVEGGEGYF